MSIKSVLQEIVQSDIKFEDYNISQDTLKEIEILRYKYNKIDLTEQSRKVLSFIQNNYDISTMFTCKDIGDKLLESPRSISGTLQKLTKLNYVEKISGKPTSYRLTKSGKNVIVDYYKNLL